MNINITNTYSLETQFIYDNKIDKIKDLKNYLEDTFLHHGIVNVLDIKIAIDEYVNWEIYEDCIYYKHNDMIVGDSDNIIVNNMDELIEYFSYLLK